jgi:hypothetical protein
LIAGTPNDGTFEGVVTFPQFSASGTWKVLEVGARDNIDNYHQWFENELMALGFPTELSNTSTVEDVTPPNLVDFSFSPTTIDTSASDATVTVSAHLTDSESGVAVSGVLFQHPGTGQQGFFYFSLIAGTPNDGTYEGVATFPKFSASGTWKVLLGAQDNIGNYYYWFENELMALGFPTELVNTPDTDGDGIPDDTDSCDASSPSATVVIDGCDSGAENDLISDGCKITDRIDDCAASAVTHDDFTACVTQLTNDLKRDGLITNKEKGTIQQCAGKADIP